MEYRHLGRTGVQVSELSYGTWVTFSNQLDVRQGNRMPWSRLRSGCELLRLRRGLCRGKGRGDPGCGAAQAGLAPGKLPGVHQVLLGYARRHKRTEYAEPQAVARGHPWSLQRLQLDYVDVIYCHRPDPITPVEETVWAMHDIIERGQAIYWGTSEWPAADIAAAIEIAERHHLHKPVTEQPEYNLFTAREVRTRVCPRLQGLWLRLHHLEPAGFRASDRQVRARESQTTAGPG